MTQTMLHRPSCQNSSEVALLGGSYASDQATSAELAVTESTCGTETDPTTERVSFLHFNHPVRCFKVVA